MQLRAIVERKHAIQALLLKAGEWQNCQSNDEEMIVTPWEVAGKIDYEKLIREFGTQPLTPELLARFENKLENYTRNSKDEFSSHTEISSGCWRNMRRERNLYYILAEALLVQFI